MQSWKGNSKLTSTSKEMDDDRSLLKMEDDLNVHVYVEDKLLFKAAVQSTEGFDNVTNSVCLLSVVYLS